MTDAQPTLSPLRRTGLVLGAWVSLVAAGPGALDPDGLPWLGAVAMALWAGAACRPGRFAFPIEWLAASLGLGATMFWIAYVFQAALPPAAVGMGLYMAVAGLVCRRLRIGWRMPVALAAPLAWVALETLRDLLEPPFGMGWLRVGHLAAAWPAWLGGARVVGVEGLSYSIVALGAGAVGAWWARGGARRAELALGLAPLVLVLAAAALTRPPATEPGPNLLLVQPSIGMYQKQGVMTWQERFQLQLDLTREGLANASEPVDAVCWPETTAPVDTLAPGVAEAIEDGLDFVPWRESGWDPRGLLNWPYAERTRIGGRVFDLLPAGTAFVCGLEQWVEHQGYLRRRNALGLWQRPELGTNGPADELDFQVGAKRKLAPGGETVLGLERYETIRGWIFETAGYLPDFLAADRTEVLHLRTRSGRTYHMGATICFDNAYEAPYLETVRREPVDLFLMASNEAWYEGSWELDQMVALSKAIAVMCGRGIVRVTNRGLTTSIAPDGREQVRLVVDGVDRERAGVLEVRVPVPAGAADEAPLPPYGHVAPWLRWIWVAAGLGLATVGSRRGGDRAPRER